MNNLDEITQLMEEITDPDLREHAQKLVEALTHSFKTMVHDRHYEIKSGLEMFQSVLDLHEECTEKSSVMGLQTIIPENMVFLQSIRLRTFNETTVQATRRGVMIRRVLLVDSTLTRKSRSLSTVIRSYYKPQLDCGVDITIHEFDSTVLKEHPGHDFTVFEIGSGKTICAEGGPIHKQADEVGYVGRIWKDENRARDLMWHFKTLRGIAQMRVPRELLRQQPKVFIGSSTEGLKIAEYMQQALANVSQPTIWSQGTFGLSEGSLEALVRISNEFDYAVLILTPDDMKTSRGATVPAARDNVLFELGLFMGSLGREKAFIVYCSDDPPELPSDLAGVTSADFPGHMELQAAVGIAATKIKSAIGRNHFFRPDEGADSI